MSGPRKTTVPAIPAIGRSPNEIDAALKAAKEAIEVGYGRRGNPLDRFVTLRELGDAGLARIGSGAGDAKLTGPITTPGSGAPLAPGDKPDFGNKDFSVPPAPTGVAVHPIPPDGLMVTWDPPAYDHHAYTELFRLPEAGRDAGGNPIAPEFDIGADGFVVNQPVSVDNPQPDFAGRANGTIYTDANLTRLTSGNPLDDALHPTAYWYWVRFVSTAGVPGPYAPLNGASGSLAIDPAAVLGQIITNVKDSSIYRELVGEVFDTRAFDPIFAAGGLTNYIATLDEDVKTTIDAQLVRLIGASDNPDGSATLIQALSRVNGEADRNSASLSSMQTWQAALTEAAGAEGAGSTYVSAPVTKVVGNVPPFDGSCHIYIGDGMTVDDVDIGTVVTLHCPDHPVLGVLDGVPLVSSGAGWYSGTNILYIISVTLPDSVTLPVGETNTLTDFVTVSVGTQGNAQGFVDFVASVYQNIVVNVTDKTAIGRAMTAVTASIGDPYHPDDGSLWAGVQQNAKAVANVDGTMETTWSVKMRQIGASGLVAAAGFGLGLDTTKNDDGTFSSVSTFLVNADQFAVMGQGAGGAIITALSANGVQASVTLQTAAHGITTATGSVVFAITDTSTQADSANPLANLAALECTVQSVSGATVTVRRTDGRSFSGFYSDLASYRNALMPAPSIPFVIDTVRNVVGIRGSLIVDGLVRATEGDFDTLTANTAFIQKLQADVVNANLIVGQRIIAGTPGAGPITDPEFDAISNYIVELSNPVHSDYPLRYFKPASGLPPSQDVFHLSQNGDMLINGALSVGGNATVRTNGNNVFTLGGSGADRDYALWIGPSGDYGTTGERRSVSNGMLWVSDDGQAGINIDTFLNADPVVLPSVTGDIGVRPQRNGAAATVFGSAVVLLFDSRDSPAKHTVLMCQLFIAPYSYSGSGSRSARSLGGNMPAAFLDDHIEVLDTFPAHWPSGAKKLAEVGLDNTSHQQSITLQGSATVPAGHYKLFVRVVNEPQYGNTSDYGATAFYPFVQQVHTPIGGASPLAAQGALQTDATEDVERPPPSNEDRTIPLLEDHVGEVLFNDGDKLVWGPAGAGPTGPTGSTGPAGAPGQIRYTGHGAPGTIIGSQPADTYLDLDTGVIYKLT